jgi:hypothetical protein
VKNRPVRMGRLEVPFRLAMVSKIRQKCKTACQATKLTKGATKTARLALASG